MTRGAEGQGGAVELPSTGSEKSSNQCSERIRRCVITCSTPDGFYPFCTINCGPSYRPFVEEMNARPLEA